ncbi:hypothetical protein ACFL16_02095 [Patescibacteria group bacterium]
MYKLKHFEEIVRSEESENDNDEIEELFLILINSSPSKTSRALKIIYEYRQDLFFEILRRDFFDSLSGDLKLDLLRTYIEHKGTYSDELIKIIFLFIFDEVQDRGAVGKIFAMISVNRPRLAREISEEVRNTES